MQGGLNRWMAILAVVVLLGALISGHGRIDVGFVRSAIIGATLCASLIGAAWVVLALFRGKRLALIAPAIATLAVNIVCIAILSGAGLPLLLLAGANVMVSTRLLTRTIALDR